MTPTAQAIADALQEVWASIQTCQHCSGAGWYAVANRTTGEPEQEQCEACLGTPHEQRVLAAIAEAVARAHEATMDKAALREHAWDKTVTFLAALRVPREQE